MLMLRKIVFFFFFLFVGLSLFAQQDYMVSSYVRGNFYNRGRISTESLRASDDLIFLNVHPNKDGSLSFENPRVFQGKGVTTWEDLIKSVRAKVKGTKVKIRLGASSGEWKAMVADKAARTTFAKNIKTVLEKNKLDGIDLDFEWEMQQSIIRMPRRRGHVSLNTNGLNSARMMRNMIYRRL